MIRRLVKQYGFVLGYLALAALVIGLVLLLARRQADAWSDGLLVSSLVLGALFALARPAQVWSFLTKRSTRQGSNAVVMIVAFASILAGLNYMAGRYYYRHDATEFDVYTLSPQSVEVLADLDAPVTIVGFFAAEDRRRDVFELLLDQYLARSDDLSYSTIDPDREPVEARQYEPVPYSGLLFLSGERRVPVYTADEQDVTGALLRVTWEEQKVIYFLTGHQEHDPESEEQAGYTTVAEALRSQGYRVDTLNLAISTTVPSDAAVVVVAGPQAGFLEGEPEQLQAYLSSGGKALIMHNPFADADLDDDLSVVLSGLHVRFGAGLVIDPASSLMGGTAAPIVSRYRFSQVTKDLSGLTTVFPLARPVEWTAGSSVEGVTFASLAETTSQSWAEMDMEASDTQFDEGVDVGGPLTLAATVDALPVDAEAGENTGLKTRLVLVGDSDFCANEFARGAGNRRLFLNAVNWLAEEEGLIAIGPKGTQAPSVFLSETQANALFVFGVVLVPIVLLVVGGLVWWLRR